MMELDSYIRDLLYRHDCVIVPDFGGFVANYKPAYINYDLNTFSPPAKDVSFNRSLIKNDGLLIGYVSEKTEMSYVDARNWVNSRVKEWKRKLEKGKKIEVKDIGVFLMGKDKNLLFEPVNTVNFLADSYGLPDFQMAPLEELKKAKAGTVKVKKEREPGSRKTLRRVLIAVPVAAVLVLIPFTTDWIPVNFSSLNPFGHKHAVQVVVPPAKPVRNKTQESRPVAAKTSGETQSEKVTNTAKPDEGTKPVTKTKKEKPAVSEEQPVTSKPAVSEEQPVTSKPSASEEKAVVEKPAVPKEKPVIDKTIDRSSMYYIVAGSFKNRANANTLRNQLESEDYRVTMLNGPHGFYRVAIGGFTDKSTAMAILKEQKGKPAGNTYWLLKK